MGIHLSILGMLPFSRPFRACRLHPTFRKAKCATILATHRLHMDMFTQLIRTLSLLLQQPRQLCDKPLLRHQVISGVIRQYQLNPPPPTLQEITDPIH